jgi:hypothetical protein
MKLTYKYNSVNEEYKLSCMFDRQTTTNMVVFW